MLETLSSFHMLSIALVAAMMVLVLITFILTIIAFRRTTRIQKKLDIIFEGKKAKDLEDVILDNNQRMKEFDTEIQELFNISNTIHTQTHKSLNKVGLVRFNPFQDYTGNQSFALALLNSKDDGTVISSIHTREGTRIYSKEIQKGAPVNNELTQEEQDAITNAT